MSDNKSNLPPNIADDWENVRDQIKGVAETKEAAALLEILALRELALAYKRRSAEPLTRVAPVAPPKHNKSFVR